jgi:plasmid stabilization system protein ParE
VDEGKRGRKRVIDLSPAAFADLGEIHLYTSHLWGRQQADRYIDFIVQSAQALATAPLMGAPLVGKDWPRLLLVRWPKARHGHYVVYDAQGEDIVIVRILRTARDVTTILSDGGNDE